MKSSEELRQQWSGDVLERKQYADFLYRLLVSKYEAAKGKNNDVGAICFALDGDWGTGKTFFTRKWAQDIKDCEHPLVVFDAWKSDLADDPLIGFIADLRAALKPWTDKMPSGDKVTEQVRAEFRGTFHKAGRAIYPTVKVMGKGMLKKFIGVESDEFLEAISGGSHTQGGQESLLDVRSVSGDAIDKLFDHSLDEHEKRLAVIEDLKRSLQKLLTYLHEHAKARLPLFVFIDELDRCRPTYAIALLEAVKHIFDVPGVCFCVSTNLAQLAESVRGVYGAGFDGPRYLKRFFSFEYTLPDPTLDSFSKLLAENSEVLARKSVVSGLSKNTQPLPPTKEIIGEVFGYVSRGFKLDLRSQQQVFEVAEAALSGIGADKPVHLLYLFNLAALRHVDRSLFSRLLVNGSFSDGMSKEMRQLMNEKCIDQYAVRSSGLPGQRVVKNLQQVTLHETFSHYVDLAQANLYHTRDSVHNVNANDKFKWIDWPLADEMPNTFQPGAYYPASIKTYSSLVKYAGQMVGPTEPPAQ